MQDVFLQYDLNLIVDSCNSTEQKREKIIKKAKSIDPNIVSVVISIYIEEKVHLKRFTKLDDGAGLEGKKRAWVDLNNEIQKPAFEKPTKNEADYAFFYDGRNKDEIFRKIEDLLS